MTHLLRQSTRADRLAARSDNGGSRGLCAANDRSTPIERAQESGLAVLAGNELNEPMRRATGRLGFTLIEQMITVAIIGILVGTASFAGGQQRALAKQELQRARALQLLEYRANLLSVGGVPAASTEAQLTENLPDAKVSVNIRGQIATLAVTWKGPEGDEQRRSLTVFTRSGR